MHHSSPSVQLWMATAVLSAAATQFSALGQTKPLAQRDVAVAFDSGMIVSKQAERAVIFSDTVTAHADAPWVRLKFGEALLGEAPAGGQPTVLRLTSRLDGAVQLMRAEHLIQWSNTSAYFNGDTVLVEVIADPGAQPSRIAINEAWVGIVEPLEPDIQETICDGVDDRVLSNEAANGRLMSVGCTAWIINDAANCFLTAGHCTTTSTSVVQFNVPLSNSNGTVNHPPPQHQYAVDLASVQFTNGGVGNDWKYFGCHPNSTTGLTPYQAQQAKYELAATAPPVAGQQIRITGYGTTSSPVSPTWNQVQKTHSGPYAEQTGTTVRYRTDTTGGNSGSPVFDLATGFCIGIHTHGGCTSTGGSNAGTAIHHGNLQAALNNPLSVCFPQGFTIEATPSSQAVCAPNQAAYTINIGKVGGNVSPVTLSASNLPVGVVATFSVNPVIPPGSSVLTISNTAAAAPGTSTLQITGTNVEFTHNTSASLSISNAIPSVPSLVSPTNGATDVPLVPTLTWTAAPQATSYAVQVSTDPNFAIITYSAAASTNSHTVASSLSPVTQYHWRVRASNTCGTSSFSSTFSFTTASIPPILLVDDDDNSPDVRSRYTATLNGMGLTYDIWDVNNGTTAGTEPTLAQLQPYTVIIWFSGDAFSTTSPKAGPSAATEAAIQSWLESGDRCWFLSAQDYLYDRLGGSGNTTPNAFMQQYLGLAVPVAHDQNYTNSTGAGIFAGLGPYTLSFSTASGGPGLSNFSDRINPSANGSAAFTYTSGGSGVARDGVYYRNLFLGFPLETLNNVADRVAVMNRFFAWCGKLSPPCPADITHDGTVNVNDLLAVINGWGPCGSPCPADCAPVGGDGVVNVNDLLAVINGWGNCP